METQMSGEIEALRLKPIPGEFLQESQSRKIAHAVQIDLAVQMIELMLNHAGMEVVGDKVELSSVAVERLHSNRLVTGHAAAQVGNTEATFPILFHLLRQRRDLGVAEHG